MKSSSWGFLVGAGLVVGGCLTDGTEGLHGAEEHGSQALVQPMLATFSASRESVAAGYPAAVRWTWTYSDTPNPEPECEIDQGIGVIPNEASTSVLISQDTDFTLTCHNDAGSDTATF